MADENRPLTTKAIATRQRILDTALALFAERGYAGTTMRDISTTADCSLGLAYRYFASKEDLILAFYWQLAEGLAQRVTTMAEATIATRFEQSMRIELAQLAPYRRASATLFGAALDPQSEVGVFGGSTSNIRSAVGAVFYNVVTGASDAPPAPQDRQLATLLYTLHFALIFAWLTDRSADGQVFEEALALTLDMLAFAGPLLAMPGTDELLARLAGVAAKIVGPAS